MNLPLPQDTQFDLSTTEPAAAAKRPCRLCEQQGNPDAALQEHVVQYVAGLDESLKVDPDVHAWRLNICQTCDACRGGLCAHCGCFVIARAVRKNRSCPHPGGEKWSVVPD